ncbi:MAG TPA: hypothetical protein VFZ44_06745 [Pyrinomonadaceae bacterium]
MTASDPQSSLSPPDKSLTLKDYLETATDASRRTRFITIVMVVASVLLLVSVLNSWDYGWISLRLDALNDPTSEYVLDKFPLTCRCDRVVQDMSEPATYCREIVGKDDRANRVYWTINLLDDQLADLEKASKDLESQARQIPAVWGETAGGHAGALQIREEIKVRREELDRDIKARQEELKAAQEARQKVCDEEKRRQATFHDSLLRSAAEAKYMVRVPFFGFALDINDVGLLGGISLCIILFLLRLSLRSQIVSLRIGFKAALVSNRAEWFYDILAARQMFVFPFLKDDDQEADVARGWTERWWMTSRRGKSYSERKRRLKSRLEEAKGRVEMYLNAREKGGSVESTSDLKAGTEEGSGDVQTGGRDKNLGEGKSSIPPENVWRVNRHTSLRVVPKLLCLLPFVIYAIQFVFDVATSPYGLKLNKWRTLGQLGTNLLCLVFILGLGLWCVTKWNELDKLWDYFNRRVEEKKGEAHQREEAASQGAAALPPRPLPSPGA